MTPHASHFFQKTPLAPSPIIYIADSSHMSVSHIGTISSPDLTIPDTYLVPKLSLNLLSVGQLCELGLNLHFFNRGVNVQDLLTGKLLGQAVRLDVYLSYATCRFPHIWSPPLLLPQPPYLQTCGILVLVMPLYLVFNY